MVCDRQASEAEDKRSQVRMGMPARIRPDELKRGTVDIAIPCFRISSSDAVTQIVNNVQGFQNPNIPLGMESMSRCQPGRDRVSNPQRSPGKRPKSKYMAVVPSINFLVKTDQGWEVKATKIKQTAHGEAGQAHLFARRGDDNGERPMCYYLAPENTEKIREILHLTEPETLDDESTTPTLSSCEFFSGSQLGSERRPGRKSPIVAWPPTPSGQRLERGEPVDSRAQGILEKCLLEKPSSYISTGVPDNTCQIANETRREERRGRSRTRRVNANKAAVLQEKRHLEKRERPRSVQVEVATASSLGVLGTFEMQKDGRKGSDNDDVSLTRKIKKEKRMRAKTERSAVHNCLRKEACQPVALLRSNKDKLSEEIVPPKERQTRKVKVMSRAQTDEKVPPSRQQKHQGVRVSTAEILTVNQNTMTKQSGEIYFTWPEADRSELSDPLPVKQPKCKEKKIAGTMSEKLQGNSVSLAQPVACASEKFTECHLAREPTPGREAHSEKSKKKMPSADVKKDLSVMPPMKSALNPTCAQTSVKKTERNLYENSADPDTDQGFLKLKQVPKRGRPQPKKPSVHNASVLPIKSASEIFSDKIAADSMYKGSEDSDDDEDFSLAQVSPARPREEEAKVVHKISEVLLDVQDQQQAPQGMPGVESNKKCFQPRGPVAKNFIWTDSTKCRVIHVAPINKLEDDEILPPELTSPKNQKNIGSVSHHDPVNSSVMKLADTTQTCSTKVSVPKPKSPSGGRVVRGLHHKDVRGRGMPEGPVKSEGKRSPRPVAENLVPGATNHRVIHVKPIHPEEEEEEQKVEQKFEEKVAAVTQKVEEKAKEEDSGKPIRHGRVTLHTLANNYTTRFAPPVVAPGPPVVKRAWSGDPPPVTLDEFVKEYREKMGLSALVTGSVPTSTPEPDSEALEDKKQPKNPQVSGSVRTSTPEPDSNPMEYQTQPEKQPDSSWPRLSQGSECKSDFSEKPSSTKESQVKNKEVKVSKFKKFQNSVAKKLFGIKKNKGQEDKKEKVSKNSEKVPVLVID